MKLKQLEKEFTKKGVLYTQMEKTEEYVLYRCKNIEFGNVYYEVFKYRTGKPHFMSGEDFDLIEVYPSNDAFGNWAFCCSDLKCVEKVMKTRMGIDWNADKYPNL